ncbi:uncharacterized protein LOC110049743 [Orbicella faveolata]|uniref:uncharacterized protein LOC110049743 n=1 Tax=Orbicella faveolata TaxID=48498 RepID=UPI0009E1A718|nr:uncharacterized protein LOC110049743 [Orbicella faveolata]
MGECHIREGLDANDVIDGAKRERTLALVVSCQYLTSVHVRKSGKHQRNTSTMNRELTYYYQGDNSSTTRNRLFSHSEERDNDSNNNNKESEKTAVCNCNRMPDTIHCKFCGQSFVGRKQISCQLHKNTIHLMDFMFCIFCKRRL